MDRIIQESRSFHHCLAVSYSQKIIEGEYVAFHMSSPCYRQSLTLGCHLLDGQLRFDQLEYPNNHKAEQLLVTIAEQFIQWLNSHLKQQPICRNFMTSDVARCGFCLNFLLKTG